MRTKKSARAAVLAVVFIFVVAALCGCGVNAEKGEGGIVPEGYKQISVHASTLYFPPNYSYSNTSDGIKYYTFSGGNANIIESDGGKVTSMKKWMYKLTLKSQFSKQGYDADINIKTYKYYELSGLLILHTAVIVKLDGKEANCYQFVYNADGKMVTVTLTYDGVKASDEVIYNILHSIALA